VTRVVPVQEAGVVIAISSIHRKDAMEAVQFCIDSLKASVPIWKKVIYADSVFNKLNYIFMVVDWWCYGGGLVVLRW